MASINFLPTLCLGGRRRETMVESITASCLCIAKAATMQWAIHHTTKVSSVCTSPTFSAREEHAMQK
jgi:hypothetical protein